MLQRDFKYNKEEANRIIEKVIDFTNLIEPEEKLEIIKEDPDDNKIIECALASKSDYIITYDKHLLKVKQFRGIKIMKPEELIDI